MSGPAAPHDAPVVARGGYAKGDARRELIVEVASEVFGTQGFRAATMLQIAAACGISRTGLLHHFPTKESLLEAVLARRDAGPSAAPSPGPAPDARGQLSRLLALVEHNATQPRIVNLFSVLSAEAGDPDHPAHRSFAARYARLRTELEEALTAAAGAGELVAGTDPQALAVEIIALMDGLQVQWVLAPSAIDMVAVLRHRLASVLTAPLDPTGHLEPSDHLDTSAPTGPDPPPTKEHG